MTGNGAELGSILAARGDHMIDALGDLVTMESPTADAGACSSCADLLGEIGRDLLGRPPERVTSGGRVHLRWRSHGPATVAVLGHFDTVWPIGTTTEWPFAVRDGVARGPGVFDMKAGLVQGLHALAALDDPEGVEVLLTSDEETGAHTSRDLVEELGRRVDAVMVLEPSADGALKVARKGISMYRLEVQGLASHAGLEPEAGVNALLELAHQVLAVAGLAEPKLGTSITPTMATAGTAMNVVPALATANFDVRALTMKEQERVHEALLRLVSVVPGTRLQVTGGPDRPPLEKRRSEALFARARALALANDLGELKGAAVGGGSDGNLTAALGTDTLDGLGAVGGGAHALTEHVVVAEMPRRATLVALLLADILGLAGRGWTQMWTAPTGKEGNEPPSR